MVETKHRLFGQNIVDTIRDLRLILGKDRKREPEYPLDPEERLRIERANERILEKKDFGRDDFGRFCNNMIVIARKADDLEEGIVTLYDEAADTYIDITEHSIYINQGKRSEENPDAPRLWQHIYYEPVHNVGRFKTTVGYIPKVESLESGIPASKDFTYFDYFEGEMKTMFPNGTQTKKRKVTKSDSQMQDFCRRANEVYVANKAGINPPLQ